jgi:protease IV
MQDTTSSKPVHDELVRALLKTRRKEVRWRNIRFFVLLVVVLFFFFSLGRAFKSGGYQKVFDARQPYVALLRLNGAIMPGSRFSALRVVPLLNQAFRDKQARAVVLLINSPGGSPVQAGLIHDRLLMLKKHYRKPLIVVGEDMLASGAYLVATSADKIEVHPDALVGSIGVVMEGFGFNQVMQKWGVQRRVMTAGKNKVRLDPFQPLKPEDQLKMQSVLNQVHTDFIDDVKQGRGARLHVQDPDLFTGDFWTGRHAVALGLADGTLDLWGVMQQYRVHQYKDYSPKSSLFPGFLRSTASLLHVPYFAETQVPLSERLDF